MVDYYLHLANEFVKIFFKGYDFFPDFDGVNGVVVRNYL
jgi:hypothetical protein